MELRHLRYFVAVAEELHFGNAAKKLHIAQPPLSQQIKDLEDELKVKLFYRTKRQVLLTDSGKVFLKDATQILEASEKAKQNITRTIKGEAGSLAIAFVVSATYSVLPDILKEYHQRFPGIELSLHEMKPYEQILGIKEKRIDVGFLRTPINDNSIETMLLAKEPFVVAMSSNHAKAKLKNIQLNDLKDENFIMFPPRHGPGLYHLTMDLFKKGNIIPKVKYEVDHIQAILALVSSGLGIAFIPLSMSTLMKKRVTYKELYPNKALVELSTAYLSENKSSALINFLHVAKEISMR